MPAPRSPWRMFLPVIAVLVLALLWSLYWFAAVRAAKATLEQQRQQLALRGLSLDCTSEDWGGYPFRFEFHCASPVLILRNRAEIRSGSLLAVALAYMPWQAVLLVDGPTSVSGRGLMPRNVNHQRAIASVTIDKFDRSTVALDAEVRKLEIPDLISVEHVMFNTRPTSGGGADVAARVEALLYRPPGKPAIALDRAEFLGVAGPERKLIISRIELQRQDIRLWGTGSLEIDASRRPSGLLSTETNDLQGLLTLLDPLLDIPDRQKANVRTVLGLLGSNAKAEIRAKDGQLFVGPILVANLKPLF